MRKISRFCVFCLLQSHGGCGIIIVSGGVTPQTKPTDTNCRMENGQVAFGRIFQKISQNFLKKVLTRLAESAIMIVQGKGTLSLVVKKSFQKTFEKPLDKPHKVWYY